MTPDPMPYSGMSDEKIPGLLVLIREPSGLFAPVILTEGQAQLIFQIISHRVNIQDRRVIVMATAAIALMATRYKDLTLDQFLETVEMNDEAIGVLDDLNVFVRMVEAEDELGPGYKAPDIPDQADDAPKSPRPSNRPGSAPPGGTTNDAPGWVTFRPSEN